MEYQKLGRSGIKVSTIGLGALHFGVFLDQEETTRIVHHAIENGVNFIDTAPMYGNGNSELFLRNALKGYRHRVILSTKAGLEPVIRKDGSFGVESATLKREYVQRSVEKSLQSLGTDHIDLFQLHAFDWSTPFEETMETLRSLIQEGKIRVIGCSNYNKQEFSRALSVIDTAGHTPLSTLQCHYNVIEQRARRELIMECKERQIGVICKRALARGILTGKYEFGRPLPEGSRGAKSSRIRECLSRKTLDLVQELKSWADRHERSVVEMALAWLLSGQEISVALVGVRNIEQLNTCIRATDWTLGNGELGEIKKIIARMGLSNQVNSLPEVFLEK